MIYLDHHAATPPCEAALVAMEAAREVGWANPASVHAAGRAARAQLEDGRRAVAAAIGAEPSDVVLTSGGTEACNLAIRGVAVGRGGKLITTAVEHPAVDEPLARVAGDTGSTLIRMPVPAGIAPDAGALAREIDRDTRLVCAQWVNHETGSVLPVADYARVCRDRGVPLFVDATQALGKLPLCVRELGADLVALASHKAGGPAGAGALWVARGVELSPLMLGGGQERGRRAGSPDVLSVVGFGAACGVLAARLGAQGRIRRRRDRLEVALTELGGQVNGAGGERCATVTNVSFEGRRGELLVAALDLLGVCASSGAACSSGLAEPSPVLLAMHGDQRWRAKSSVRFSLGPQTSDIDIENTISACRRALESGGAGPS
ncbi:MAG: cysteine desulfurase family protein [Myxococcales bacterium]|jgi:cysteine desulfurase